MRVARLIAILLAILLTACGPAKPPPATATAVAPSPTSPALPASVLVTGRVYDLSEGPASPIANSRIAFELRREGTTAVSGEMVSDAEGNFSLAVPLQEAAALHLLATAPGYSPAELYLTTAQLQAGVRADIGLNPPTETALRLEGFQWTPSTSDASIEEWAKPDVGGLLRLYFTNIGTLPVSFAALRLDDIAIAQQVATRRVQWWRIRPEPLAPGQMGVWEIKLADTPAQIKLSLYPQEARAAHAIIEPVRSPLSLRYLALSREGERILAFVRNDDPYALIHLDAISLNGAQVPAEIKQPDIAPGEVALALITPDLLPAAGDLVCIEVNGQLQDGTDVSAWSATRLWQSVFPLGMRADRQTLEKAAMDDLQQHGLNTLLLDLPASPTDSFWIQLQERDDFWVVATPTFPPDRAQLAVFAGSPRLLAWLVQDYPEIEAVQMPQLQVRDEGTRANASWRIAPELITAEAVFREITYQPTYLNLMSRHLLPKYAPIGDISGVQHYAIDAPAANGTGSHSLAEVLTYTLSLRDLAAPAPIWPWAQALCSTGWRQDPQACWNRLPTPAEMRAQLYLQLAAGAKGIFWGDYRAAWAAESAAQWEEVGAQNRMLGAIADLLLYGEPAATVTVPTQTHASAIVSERAVAVPVVNLDYAWERRTWAADSSPPEPSPPYAFRLREGLVFSVLVPEWITPRQLFAVTPTGTADIQWAAQGRLLSFTLPSLDDVALVVISGDTELRTEIHNRLR